MDDSQACIHVVDDDAAFRAGYAMNLRAEGLPIQPYDSAEAFLAEPLWPKRGVVSLDIDFAPGQLNGLQAFDRLLAEGSSMPVVFLTGPHDKDVRMAVSLVTRRADVEFFPKHATAESAGASDAPLIEALRRFLRAEPALWRQAEDERAVLQCVLDELTPAERRVLNFLVHDRGLKSFTIASELGKTEGVIELQRLSGQRKLLGEGRSRPSVAERVGPVLRRHGLSDLQALARVELLRRLALLSPLERRLVLLLADGRSPTQVARTLGWPPTDEKGRNPSQQVEHQARRAWILLQSSGASQLRRWCLSTLDGVPEEASLPVA